MAKTITDKKRAKNLGITEKLYNRIKEQVPQEINTSFSFMTPKWEEWQRRLKIYNNQKKKQSAVSDPMLFTQFQTVFASLYDDKLKVGFAPRTKADIERVENLNPLYEYDATDMEKDIIDYKWTWNTLFFGHALCMLNNWDSKLKTPIPEVVNMLTWHRDPNATSMNGDAKGRGASRFGGRPISMTLNDFETNKNYKNVEELVESENETKQDAEFEVNEAQGFSSVGDVEGDNKNYTIMEWYTHIFMDEHDEKGNNKGRKLKKVLIGIQGNLIVRFTVLKDQDEWGIIDRMIYPDSMSWDGVSIPDLIEDKQRANSRILNASVFNVEANTHQMGLYDKNKIAKASYLNFGFNKQIPVNGDVNGVYAPINRPQVGNEVNYIMETLKDLSQRATGATEIQQGAVTGSKRTATEVATVSEGADTRFSLSSKIFGWSERRFAQYWYKMYKMYYTEAIDEKVIRVNGLIGYKWKSLSKKDIVGDADPDVKVESKLVSEARRLRELQNFTNSYQIFVQDPTTNKEFLTRELARLSGYSSVKMSMLFKDNPERLIAQEENEKMEKGEIVKIHKTDDDYLHIEEHEKEEKAVEHIKAHLEQIIVKAKNQNVKAEVEEMDAMKQPQEQPQEPIGQIDFSTPKTLQTA